MSEMRLVLHREIPEDEEFRQRWNVLVEAMEHPQVFYTWEWAAAVAHAYGDALRPLLFAAYETEKLIGIAALALDSRGEVCFLASTTADYCDFVSAPGDRKELIERVMAELRRMGTADLKLANLPADSVSATVLRAAGKMSGYGMFARPAYLCAQIPLRSKEERESIARSARRNSRRAKKAMAGMGEVAVEHQGTGDRLKAELPALATAHVGRFLAQGRMSNLMDGARRRFLEDLGQRLFAQGMLALSTIRIGDRTVAWHYGFQYSGSWFWYLPVFDSELQHLKTGPGSCLFYEILLRASEDSGIDTVDLGLGDEGYKDRYATGGRQTLYVTMSRSRAGLARDFCRYKAAKVVAEAPAVEARVRRTVARLKSLRRRWTTMGMWRTLAFCFSRAKKIFFDDAEVCFLDWSPQESLSSRSIERDDELHLRPLSTNLLAAAAMEYENDPETRDYLLRSANRLKSPGVEGYAMVTSREMPVHFSWVAPFEGFPMTELGCALEGPTAQSVLLHDGWTPKAQGERGGFARCASAVAELEAEKGKRPWIFSAEQNSIMELGQAGFVPRFSLRQGKTLFLRRTRRVEFADRETGAMNLNPAA